MAGKWRCADAGWPGTRGTFIVSGGGRLLCFNVLSLDEPTRISQMHQLMTTWLMRDNNFLWLPSTEVKKKNCRTSCRCWQTNLRGQNASDQCRVIQGWPRVSIIHIKTRFHFFVSCRRLLARQARLLTLCMHHGGLLPVISQRAATHRLACSGTKVA